MVEPIESVFPGLGKSAYRVTSPPTRDYNCIAWTAADTARWWWPDADPDDDAQYWPAGVPSEEAVEAFVAAFATIGYVPCAGEELEGGFERIALFAITGVPTHAARQLPTGRWTSKLGLREDIEHALRDLEGEAYGTVVLIMKRPVATAASP